MANQESVTLDCNIKSLEAFSKQEASLKALSIPEASRRQPDLMYMIDIMVSTGGNLNSAYFLPSEVYAARGSIVGKAVDILHEEDQVVGHITGYAFLDKNGNPLDVDALKKSKSEEEFDKLSFDVATSSVIHKLRFPEIANRIDERHFKVSMECYYEKFDVKVGDMIISQDEAVRHGLVEIIGGKAKLVDGKNEEIADVFRVLRNIHFSGKGLVDKPANPDSLILEAASIRQRSFDHDSIPIINLANIESYRKMKQESESIVINTREDSSKHVPPIMAPSLPSHENLCVSFERYVYAIPGEDEGDKQMPTRSAVARENYCKLFDLDCEVAGQSSHFQCWRNVFNRTTKEEIRHAFDALLAEQRKSGIMEMSAVQGSVVELSNKIDKADKYLLKNAERIRKSFEADYEAAAPKSVKSTNNLPNSSFAIVEPGYTDGGNKNARHLPHHGPGGGGTSNVNLDMPRLRNALARAGQIKPVTDSISREELVKRAKSHLEKHRGALKTSK